MTTSPPFFTTAATVEYTPECQDPEKLKITRLAEINDQKAALARARKIAEEIQDEETRTLELAVAADREQEMENELSRLDQQIQAKKRRYPDPMKFLIAVPTSIEREQLNSRLIALGMRSISQDVFRATLIDELYYQDWTRPGEEPSDSRNLDRAEEMANFLDSYWQKQEVEAEARLRWAEQEVERMLDEQAGAAKREGEPKPPSMLSARDKARGLMITEEMMAKSQRLRDLAALQQDTARITTMLMVRIHVVGAVNEDLQKLLDWDKRTRALTAASCDALRERCDDATWRDLVAYIDSLYSVSETERKNSDSPASNTMIETGSLEPLEAETGNDGSSTISNIEPAPAAESETIIDTSSSSTIVSSVAPESTVVSNFRTAGDLLTSQ